MRSFGNCGPLLLAAGLLGLCGAAQGQVLWQKTYLGGQPGVDGVSYTASAKLANNRYVHVGVSNSSPAPGSYLSHPYYLFTNAQADSVGGLYTSAPNDTPAEVVGNGDGTFTWLGFRLVVMPQRNYEHLFTRVNQQGQTLWEIPFHLPNTAINRPTAGQVGGLLRTPDGYIAAADSAEYVPPTSFSLTPRQVLYRFDNLGRQVWRLYVPGDATTQDVKKQDNGSYVACGYVGQRTPLTSSFRYALDWRLVEFTHGGDTLRTRRFGIEGDMDQAVRLAPTVDHGLAVLTRYEPRLGSTGEQTHLVKLDSLWRVQWDVRVDALGSRYLTDLAVTTAGEYLLTGGLLQANRRTVGVVARYAATGQALGTVTAGPAANPDSYFSRLVYEPGDPLMAWGSTFVPNVPGPGVAPTTQRFFSAGFGGVAPPFVPAYCRYPPQPLVSASRPQPDSLVLLELHTAGPRYAQAVAFRWELGDGTVVERATGGPVRHRYAAGQVPPPGTAVRLTVTNNLGCAGTVVVYPFGRPSATQAARALAGRVALFPNPAAETATLRLAAAPPGPATVRVLDALGRLVLAYATQPQAGQLEQALDLRPLPPGVYTVQLSTAAGSCTKRLVRQ